MNTDIEFMNTQMYTHLLSRGAGHELALKVARIADEHKSRSLATWKTFHPRHMVSMGLNTQEAILVRAILHSDVLPLPEGVHRPPQSSLLYTGAVTLVGATIFATLLLVL
jgi:hypothetical protein